MAVASSDLHPRERRAKLAPANDGRVACFCAISGGANQILDGRAANATRKPRFIEMFAGGGGLALGLASAGFDPIALLEVHPMACATLSKRFGAGRVRCGDITGVGARQLRKELGLARGELELLSAGLPCQGFSSSNSRTRSMANPANLLYRQVGRFLHEFQPQTFLVENVLHLAFMDSGAVLATILRSLRAYGYGVRWAILDAADFGVPQHRRRVILLGSRGSQPPAMPLGSPTRVSVRDALADLPQRIRNGNRTDLLAYALPRGRASAYAKRLRGAAKMVSGNEVSRNSLATRKRYRYLHPGDNWEAIPARLLKTYEDVSRTHSGIYRRLRSDAPSGAIGNFRKNMLVHPSCARTLTIREAARLQSFPDGYEFVGSLGSRQKQVGNAVPPRLGHALGVALRVHLGKRPSAVISSCRTETDSSASG